MTGFPEHVEAIRARAAAATPGPWGWFGNTGVQQVYLATKSWGRHIVMNFARWGMQGAQPQFFGGRTVSRDEAGRVDIRGAIPQSTADSAIYEVAPGALSAKDDRVYRTDLIGIRNPDAAFIAHSREDVDWLLAEHDRLQRIIAEGIYLTDTDDITAVRQIGWYCEHKYGTPSAGTHMKWEHRKGKLVPDKNVSGSMSHLHSWSPNEERCPESVPMLLAVSKSEQVPA